MEISVAFLVAVLASVTADGPSCTPKHIPLPMGTITASSFDSQYTPGDIHYVNCSDVPFIVSRSHVGWCPDPHDKSPRIQVKLPKQMSIHGIVFQSTFAKCGDMSHDYGLDGFLRTFNLQYVLPGDHEQNLVTYGEDIDALDGMTAEKKFEFATPIVTKTLSLVPKEFNIWPCFRFKLYGCDAEDLCPQDFCQNGGSCSGKDFCSCPTGFYGNQCNQTVEDLTLYNYGFESIENNTLKTPDANFIVNEFVSLTQDRRRHGHHNERHGQSCHFQGNHHGHHGHCEYHSNNHHDNHHHSNHHDSHGHHGMSVSGPHSHCMSNLHSGHHGFTTSLNANIGQNHNTHGHHTYLYSNGGNLAGHNGASLSYHNNNLHFHVSTDTHHWHVSHPCTLNNGQWNTITTSWHPHQGAQIHINNNHVASCTNPKPNPQPCTNQVTLRLGDGHDTTTVNVNINLNFNLKVQGLVSAPCSSTSLSNLGIKASGAFTTPAPTTTSTTTTTTPKPTTKPMVTLTSTHPSVSSTTSGPYRPICYSYTNEAQVGASSHSKQCQAGEVCSLFEDKHGYTAKCLSKILCDAGKSLAGSQCWECCNSYLCNKQCNSVKSTCQDKATCQTMIATGYDVCKDPKMSVDLCSKTCNICSP